MSNIRVAVINASTTLTDAEVQAVVPALQVQVHNDFAPAWGIDADLSFVGTGGQPAPGAWSLAIMDNSDQQDALGYRRCRPMRRSRRRGNFAVWCRTRSASRHSAVWFGIDPRGSRLHRFDD